MSSKQSYTIRFRVFVENLSRKHEIIDTIGFTDYYEVREGSNPKLNTKCRRCDFGASNENVIKSKKRTYEDSFGNRDYEFERYGQEIDADFFTHNVGHATI